MIIGKIYNKATQLYRLWRLRKKIGHIGNNCEIGKYYCIEGVDVTIGDNVSIAEGAWIKSNPCLCNDKLRLSIGDGCIIGRFNEIYATKSVVLEEKVLTAERVYISDNQHGFSNPYVPIMDQPIVQNNTVRIGVGSWIGAGVAILGANIGKHCIIGANAVVTHDIPDYCIAVGIPAKVIKRFDFNLNKWVRL